MTSIEDLVAELATLEIGLSADGGSLRISAPSGVLTRELKATLAARKPELLQLLAAAERGSGTVESALAPGARTEPIPLSPGQRRIWSLAEMHPDSNVYNTSTAYRLVGPLNLLALERSLSALQQRHEILRTTFSAEQREPRQCISPPQPLVLPIVSIVKELKKVPDEEWENEILGLLHTEVQGAFDLERGPLWRPLLLRIGEDDHILSLTIHHIIFDGGSDAILLRELSAFYRMASKNQPLELAPLPIQYADYACWQQARMAGEEGRRQLAYWRKKLDGVAGELRLPIDRRREGDTTFRGENVRFTLPDELVDGLSAVSREEQSGWFATLLAAYVALLHRYTGQEDLMVCSPFAARDRAQLEQLIGYFNSIVVLRADLSGDPSFRELAARIRRLGGEAADNQNLPLQRVAALPNLARVAVTRGMFCYQDLTTRVLDLPEITASPVDLRKATADFDLAMYMQGAEDGEVTGVLEYDAGLFERSTIRELVDDFQTLLAAVAADPDRRLSELPRFGLSAAALEARLEDHAQIDQVAVVELPDHSGSVAYLVLNEYDTPTLDDVLRIARGAMPEYLVPLAFVPLDQMPLTADGQVDHGALPLPGVVKGRPATEYVAPRTRLEAKLAEIWSKVLWLDEKVGVRDRFSDLGGHSLLAVQLVLEIERVLDRPLAVAALSRMNTIEEMATALEAGEREGVPGTGAVAAPRALAIPQKTYLALLTYTATWEGARVSRESLVVGLNTDGRKEPLFWCLQRYGELTQLAKYLGEDQPVYGMRSGNRVMLKTQPNIDALAAQYVNEILAVKPDGPFLLGGNCQAGDIAFQIAKGLERQGHEVALLVLLEKFVPQEYRGRIAMLFGKDSNRNPYLHYREPEIGWQKFYLGEHTVDLVSGKHARFFREPNIQGLAETVARRLAEVGQPEAQSFKATSASTAHRQRLPEAAYRARLAARPSVAVSPGETFTIRVEVENASPEPWRAGDVSGIALANRWRNAKGGLVVSLDGRAPLAADLEPGARATLEIAVRAPRKTGHFTLQLHLVDEGIASFTDRGSPPADVAVHVRRNTRIPSLFRTLFRGPTHR